MALTRPKIWDIDTNIEYFVDPITVLHQGATSANVDVGFLFNRANGLVSNVALYWNESTSAFVTAFTSNTGITNSNILPTTYANITTGHHLPGENVTYNLGSPTQRWNTLYISGNTIDMAGHTISTSTGQITFSTPQGGLIAGIFSTLAANANTPSTSISTGTMVITGGAGISGNLYVGGNLDVVGTTIFRNTEVVTNTEYASTINATNVYATTIGNIGANVIGTGTYLTSLTATNVLGTVATANISYYDNISATTTNATYYPAIFSQASGNVVNNTSTGLTFNPSTSTLNTGTVLATTINASTIGNTGAVYTGSTLSLSSWANIAGPLVVTNNTAVQAIQVAGTSTKGGAGYHDFLLITNQGGGTNPNKTFRLNSTGGLEIINSAYSNNIFTLTDAGVLTVPQISASGSTGTSGQVLSSTGSGLQWVASGGFSGGAVPNQTTFASNIVAASGTASTNSTTGAVVVLGGVGVSGNVWAGQVYATNNGNGTNFAVGDDSWIGDINVANTMGIKGQQDGTQGYIVFGNTNNTNYIGRSGSNPITVTGAFNITGTTTTAAVTSSGTIIASTLNAGTIGNIGALITGTLQTAAQTNITSVGTLSALTVTGNIVGGGIRSTTSSSVPVTPTVGDIWYSTTDDTIYRYTNDGSSSYWLDVTGPTVANVIAMSTLTVTGDVLAKNVLNPFLLAGM